MEIGDKVKFNKYVPINESGVPFKKIVDTYISFSDEPDVIHKRKQGLYPWERKVNDGESTSSWQIRKFDIDEKEGIYIGSIRKKIKRSYKIRPIEEPTEVIAEEQSSWEHLRTRPIVRGPSIIGRPRARFDRPSRNQNRLDDPYKRDELAIIAVSKTKRYVVDMEDILIYNFNSKIKII